MFEMMATAPSSLPGKGRDSSERQDVNRTILRLMQDIKGTYEA